MSIRGTKTGSVVSMIVNQSAMNRFRSCRNLDDVHRLMFPASFSRCTEREVRIAISQLFLYNGILKASVIETIIGAALQRNYSFINVVSNICAEDGSTILCLKFFDTMWAFKWNNNTLFFPCECDCDTDIQAIQFKACKYYRSDHSDEYE